MASLNCLNLVGCEEAGDDGVLGAAGMAATIIIMALFRIGVLEDVSS
jgi:hypothetical protein